MTLNASGPISLGGSTTGQSVNLELGKSATAQISFNDTLVRALTGTSSGTALIMPTNFYGLAALDVQTVTTGASGTAGQLNRVRGFNTVGNLGSISDGTSDIYGGAPVTYLLWDEGGGFPDSFYSLYITGGTGPYNGGWTTMTVGSKAFSRTSASFTDDGLGGAYWTWSTTDSASTQAFGTAGTVVSVLFT